MVKLIEANSEKHLEHIRELFKEYAESLGFTLDFQNFNKELAELPGEYAPPAGRLILALWDDEIAGCVALRKFKDTICEMKRMYVKARFRRKGIGRQLAENIVKEARKIGYTHMRIDTIETMKQANSLYKSMGFKEIKPYRYNPIKGAKYMELSLKDCTMDNAKH